MRTTTIAIALAVIGCSEGASDSPPDASSEPPADAAPPVYSACPPGEFAQGFELDGTLRCSTIDEAATTAFSSHCSLFFGWNDSCDGCTTTPTKWGRASGDSCQNGLGAGNSCVMTDLGGVTLPLLGLDLDGDVNDDDKFHLGLDCTPPADDEVDGPCAPGSFLTSIVNGQTTCSTGAAAIAESFARGCEVYFGWRDSCDGCTSAPLKWGHSGSDACTLGAGVDSTCTSFNLDGTAIFALGINTDGDVGGDDKFYFGFQCTGAVASEGLTSQACPPGELVVAIDEDGIRCASPALAAEAAVADGCYLYVGWRDSCNGCATPPSKWGRVGQTLCENGVGVDNTCASTPLDGTSVELFGLNTDGDVDGNDKLYIGMSCPAP